MISSLVFCFIYLCSTHLLTLLSCVEHNYMKNLKLKYI